MTFLFLFLFIWTVEGFQVFIYINVVCTFIEQLKSPVLAFKLRVTRLLRLTRLSFKMSQMHSHGPGQPMHSHGPSGPSGPQQPIQLTPEQIQQLQQLQAQQQQQQRMVQQQQPDPEIQAAIDANFQEVKFSLDQSKNNSLLCEKHQKQKCDECKVDFTAVNELAARIAGLPSPIPPPPAMTNNQIAQLVTKAKEEGNVCHIPTYPIQIAYFQY